MCFNEYSPSIGRSPLADHLPAGTCSQVVIVPVSKLSESCPMALVTKRISETKTESISLDMAISFRLNNLQIFLAEVKPFRHIFLFYSLFLSIQPSNFLVSMAILISPLLIYYMGFK